MFKKLKQWYCKHFGHWIGLGYCPRCQCHVSPNHYPIPDDEFMGYEPGTDNPIVKFTYYTDDYGAIRPYPAARYIHKCYNKDPGGHMESDCHNYHKWP